MATCPRSRFTPSQPRRKPPNYERDGWNSYDETITTPLHTTVYVLDILLIAGLQTIIPIQPCLSTIIINYPKTPGQHRYWIKEPVHQWMLTVIMQIQAAASTGVQTMPMLCRLLRLVHFITGKGRGCSSLIHVLICVQFESYIHIISPRDKIINNLRAHSFCSQCWWIKYYFRQISAK